MHKICTVGNGERKDSLILKDLVAGEPVSRIVRATPRFLRLSSNQRNGSVIDVNSVSFFPIVGTILAAF